MSEPTTADAIVLSGVSKRFGRTQALRELDLRVAKGEIHGFLGPNGAGKTTAIRVLLGLLRADAGEARLLGGDPWGEATALHRRLAYVPGDVTLWPSLTGGEVIDLLGRLRGGLDPRRKAALIERFELDPRKKSRAYSKGNRQKVALIAALASDVELLLLDEPTSGLDPLKSAVFKEVVAAENRERGRTVLLSSHILAEVEGLCERVTIIREGKDVERGTLHQLRHLSRTSIEAELGASVETDGIAGDQLRALETLVGVHDLELEGRRLSCQVDASALGPLLGRLAAVGVESLVSQPPTLEALFLRYYESSDPGARDPTPGGEERP